MTVLPSLPDDLMLMIFVNLTSKERVPLGTACKRFRDLDFEIGEKKFEVIEVRRTSDMHSIAAIAEGTHFHIRGKRSRPIKANSHNLRLFKHAKTKFLHILYTRSDCAKSEFRIISNLFHSVVYNCVKVEFICEQDCSENFILSLTMNRSLEEVEVHLSWRSYHSAHNLHRTRRLLLMLPKMDKLRVDWIATSDIFHCDDCLIDDVTLLHLTYHSNHTELCMGQCTAQGILSAFETVCQSEDYKFLRFNTHKLPVQQLLSMPELKFEREMLSKGKFRLIDRSSLSIMCVSYWREYCEIEMGKMNDGKEIMKNGVIWNVQYT